MPKENPQNKKTTGISSLKSHLKADLKTILDQEDIDTTVIDKVQTAMETILFDDAPYIDIEVAEDIPTSETQQNAQTGAQTIGFDLFDEDITEDAGDLQHFPQFDPDRYIKKGTLGAGSMGEVQLLFDKVLNREVACKTINKKLQSRPGILSRFIEEAQVVSQLQHSNIVPVHEIGVMSDGSIYFTMQVIRGKPFSTFIDEVHQAVNENGWQTTESGWSFYRLIDVFVQICETMHFAHEKGVIHRDLKPENIMIGEYGEVLVVDWGVCKILGHTHVSEDQIESTRFDERAHATRIGQITGTPAYMPPEQAKGDILALDHRSDIYALGAILYNIISGLPPYTGQTGRQVITQVLTGPPNPVRNTLITRTATAFGKSLSQLSMNTFIDDDLPLPELPEPVTAENFSGPPISMELIKACEKSMSRDMNKRHETAKELASVIRDWREGTKRTLQAKEFTEKAIALTSQIDHLEQSGKAAIDLAKKALFALPSWAPFDKKEPHWKSLKQGEEKLEEAAKLTTKKELLLENALLQRSDYTEANAEMLKLLHRMHQSMDESVLAQAVAKRMENHVSTLPEVDPLRIEMGRYLEGVGELTLVTNVPGADVYISTIREENRLLVETDERFLGKTPLLHIPLEMGSYLLTIRKSGHHDVRYPVYIERNEHWTGIAPGETTPHPIVLPPLGTIEDGACYVPAGWFICGGDPNLPNCFPKTKVWVDGYVIGQYHVSTPEFMACINDLLQQGKQSLVDQIIPGMAGMPFVKPKEDGTLAFMTPQFPEADFSELPITWVNAKAALSYTHWLRETTGKLWRLPYEIEFEKASRGVDGRFFPMGNHYDPTWILTDDTHSPLPAGKNDYVRDRSIYGVRYLAGNIADWTLGADLTEFSIDANGRHIKKYDNLIEPTPEMSCRGGASLVSQRYTRCTYRQFYVPQNTNPVVSFRIARPITEKAK